MQLEGIDPSSKGFQKGFATSKLNHTVFISLHGQVTDLPFSMGKSSISTPRPIHG